MYIFFSVIFGLIKERFRDNQTEFSFQFQFYGPRIGAIYHRLGVPIDPPLFMGGGQEFKRRSGTENTPMIAGLGEAARLVKNGDFPTNLVKKRQFFLDKLKSNRKREQFVKLNFEDQPRLPNTSSLSFANIDSGELLKNCEGKIEASRSAACHTDPKLTASGVLIKSGLNFDEARGTLRISLGRYTTFEELEKAAHILYTAYDKTLND